MKDLSTSVEIKSLIYNIRGKAVMLDSALATLYRVPTSRLNEAVKRNLKRFPPDFMFQLTADEFKDLMSHFAISSGHGGRRKMPYAFTEQGIAMLSGVLNSDIAIEVNIQIMRAFVQMRRLSLTIVDLKRKIDAIEKKYDDQFRVIFTALRQLITPPLTDKKKRKMGFVSNRKDQTTQAS